MGIFDWLPFGEAHRRRVKQSKEATEALQNALEEAHVRELDLKNATESMRRSREEFKKARKAAADPSTMTGT